MNRSSKAASDAPSSPVSGHKALLVGLLLAGLIAGFGAGYYVGHARGGEEKVSHAAAPSATADAMAKPPTAMDPESQARMEQARKEITGLHQQLQKDPQNLDLALTLANRLYDIRDFRQCIPLYQRILEKRPDDLPVRVDLGTAQWYDGDVDHAVQNLEAALRKNPEHPQALNNLGIIMLHGRNDLAGAKTYWEKLLKTRTKEVDLERVKQRLDVVNQMLKDGKGMPTGMTGGGAGASGSSVVGK